MTPPGFATAPAPTRFVFPPPMEFLETSVYEYGFQDFSGGSAYPDPRNGFQYYNAGGQHVFNNGFQEQNPLAFMQEFFGGNQAAADHGKGHHDPSNAGADNVQGDGCDEGLLNGCGDRGGCTHDDICTQGGKGAENEPILPSNST